MSYTNCPRPPHELPDMCETCESIRTEQRQGGHHTFLAIDWGYTLTGETCLWYCSVTCLRMSSVPTIEHAEQGKLWPSVERLLAA